MLSKLNRWVTAQLRYSGMRIEGKAIRIKARDTDEKDKLTSLDSIYSLHPPTTKAVRGRKEYTVFLKLSKILNFRASNFISPCRPPLS